jgi:4-hydroxy-3-methylbut-2-enyl diphosphate reductase
MEKMKQIVLVRPRGFCAGVERAVMIVERLLDKFGSSLYVRHAIVHNQQVIEDFEKRGAIFTETLETIPEGARVVFSAHGSPPSLYTEAKRRKLKVIDATCPLVTKVHQEAKRYAEADYFIFYVGHKGHAEAIGVLGEVPKEKVVLIESVAEAESVEPPQVDKLVVLNQTTFSLDDIEEIVDSLKKRFPKLVLPPGKDICYATQNRQEAVLILVVGSKASSNSNRLRDVAKEVGVRSYLVEDIEAIQWSWLEGVERLGITSGASAPERLVEEMVVELEKRYPGVTVDEKVVKEEKGINFSLPREVEEK